MTHNFDYDYFVIGGGSGGVRTARIAASHGAKVGLAESNKMGGTCVNVGCVPKKLMAYAADIPKTFEDAHGYGWSLNGTPTFDWNDFIARKNAEIERLNGIYDGLLEKAGVTLYKGFASFIDKHTLKVGDEKITADKIVIAAGGTPRFMKVPGEELSVTSDGVFYLDKQPEHIVIVGAGYIGVEFAHIFHGMGSKVTLVHRGDKVLRGFDEDIRDKLQEDMKAQGIDLCLECYAETIEEKNGRKLVTMTDGNVLECDCVLAAIGRIPNTAALNLDKIGIEHKENGQIRIDEYYRTNIDNIYAIGDITNNHNLTPVAITEGHYLADRLFGDKGCDETLCFEKIPTAVFSYPEIATVGITEDTAKDRGYNVKCYTSTFRPMKYTLPDRQQKTMMKLVVDQDSDDILGIHMIGLDAAEIMQGFGVAFVIGAKKADFDRTVGIHPTSAEEFVTMR